MTTPSIPMPTAPPPANFPQFPAGTSDNAIVSTADKIKPSGSYVAHVNFLFENPAIKVLIAGTGLGAICGAVLPHLPSTARIKFAWGSLITLIGVLAAPSPYPYDNINPIIAWLNTKSRSIEKDKKVFLESNNFQYLDKGLDGKLHNARDLYQVILPQAYSSPQQPASMLGQGISSQAINSPLPRQLAPRQMTYTPSSGMLFPYK